MINTIQIHYQYDEGKGMLPSGLPSSPAYCGPRCPFLNTEGEKTQCDLFMVTLEKEIIGEPSRPLRLAYIPAHACRHHEMQGR